ncbi:hypothetical protein [Nucisporomicrobium flavum]|uniref:hypothetical protein n=1 Tax=Nucisporomicrobium flavum TaxID=2785915 RepID=UPI0018F65848|nr:hypothetical protein [Nucisporomicrobium flavum]
MVDAVHAEAGKWRKLSGDMAAVHADVVRLELYPTAFFFADVVSVEGHAIAYRTFHDWYQQLLGDATTEFGEIAGALDKSAEAYRNADTRSSVNLKTIYGTRPEGN